MPNRWAGTTSSSRLAAVFTETARTSPYDERRPSSRGVACKSLCKIRAVGIQLKLTESRPNESTSRLTDSQFMPGTLPDIAVETRGHRHRPWRASYWRSSGPSPGRPCRQAESRMPCATVGVVEGAHWLDKACDVCLSLTGPEGEEGLQMARGRVGVVVAAASALVLNAATASALASNEGPSRSIAHPNG